MDPLEQAFNKTINIDRMGPGQGDVEGYISHLSGVGCCIQPLDDSYSEDLDGSFGKESILYCDDLDILEGDRVVDGGTNYKVIGVKRIEFLNLPVHMEARIREFNQ
jgi:hypothetical protein